MSICLGDSGTSSGYTSIAMSKSSSSASNTNTFVAISKSSSSISNTTISILPVETSALEGLGHINIDPFIGIENMRKAIDLQSIRLQEGVSNQQYLVFKPVTKVNLTKIDRARNDIGKHTRMTHYTDTDLLIVKLMPSAEHESAHLKFSYRLVAKVTGMGMSIDELCSLGGTRFFSHTSSKEGDSSFKPSSRKKKTDWPTIVFESGLFETLSQLRCDARWWLANSNGEVKIVIIISIKPVQKSLRIEKWEHVQNPIQEITIIDRTITGAPLVLEFEKIFLRAVIPPQSDIIFTIEDLSGWADAFWQAVE